VTAADYEFTLDDLARGGSQRAAVELALEGLVDRLDLGDTYDDVLDRLEGPWEVDGVWRRLDLPLDTSDPVYRRLLAIAREVRRNTRD